MQHSKHSKAPNQNIVDLLQSDTLVSSPKKVYSYIQKHNVDNVEAVSYVELATHARTIGGYLQQHKLKGERALLLFPAGPDFPAAFLGCLHAGVLAVPAIPPLNNRALIQIKSIISDAKPRVILSTTGMQRLLNRLLTFSNINIPFIKTLASHIVPCDLEEELSFDGIDWINIDTISSAYDALWKPFTIKPDDIAFLQYTSGSTASPKGVMVSHNNIASNIHMIKQSYSFSDNMPMVVWTPHYHDMGLFAGVIFPIFQPSQNIFISPMDFLHNPLLWLEAISKFQANVSGGPNFGYDLCVKKANDTPLDNIDLSSWELAYNGAEPIRHSTLKNFSDTFAPCGFRESAFYPTYGLAEATVFVAGPDTNKGVTVCYADKCALKHNALELVTKQTNNTVTMVSCGSAKEGETIVIADPESCNQLPEGKIGEIWLHGSNLAKGYYHNPSATRTSFKAHLKGNKKEAFYRTGDLGFMLDKQLYVTGRIKDMIIIAGENFYPQDIELAAENSHSMLRKGCNAAFSVVTSNGEGLVIVQEIKQEIEHHKLGAIKDAIYQAVLQEAGIAPLHIVLIKPRTITKTSSGKIQRHACYDAWCNKTLHRAG